MLPDPLNPFQDGQELILILHDVSRFAKGYNMSYIFMPAYAPENSIQASWWKISNYTDLSDTSVFQDFQSKLLRLATKEPFVVRSGNAPNNGETSGSTLVVSVLLGTVGILIGALTFVIVKARRNAKILADKEVRRFIYGRKTGVPELGGTEDVNMSHNNKQYNKSFEVSMHDIFVEPDNVLGSGYFGIVHKAHMRSGGLKLDPVAVKMPKKECDRQTFISMLREVKLLCCLGNHQNLVEFIGCYTKEIQSGLLYIVMELCTGGNLLAHLRTMKTTQKHLQHNIAELTRFCREIASGMEYISGKRVVHGGHAARNVLLNDLKVCKISDFGLSRKLYGYQTYKKKEQEPLPWQWMSYESLLKVQFSIKSDVWSFGITAWEIFSLGDLPYPGLSWNIDFTKEVFEGLRPSQPYLASAEIYDMMKTCWDIEPAQRPDFAILYHFFSCLVDYAVVTNDGEERDSGNTNMISKI